MSFTAKFTLVLEWFDWRLIWRDLNEDHSLNIPNKDIIENIWVPVFIFHNTKTKIRTPIDEVTRFVVKKKGSYELSTDVEVEEIAFFKGSENSLLYSRDFYSTFSCDFDLRSYPFDTQMCTMRIKNQEKERKFVSLNPLEVIYSEPMGMAEFVMTSYKMDTESSGNDMDLVVKIWMKRRVFKHLLGTYLPSLCILIICQVIFEALVKNLWQLFT